LFLFFVLVLVFGFWFLVFGSWFVFWFLFLVLGLLLEFFTFWKSSKFSDKDRAYRGNMKVNLNLHYIYIVLEFGESIAKNAKRTVECYRLSATNGDIESQIAFGSCTEHGIGVKQNVSESLAFYQGAAEQKDRAGAFHCALLHQYGVGGDEDFDEAASYYPLPGDRPFIPHHAFRCLRILTKAPAPRPLLS
jgi:hypothetical protein